MTFLCLAAAFEKFQNNPLQTFRKRQLNEGIFFTELSSTNKESV